MSHSIPCLQAPGVELGLSLEDLPDERWNEYTTTAIGCVKPKDVRVHLAFKIIIIDSLVRKNKKFIFYFIWNYTNSV